jgi:phosphate starvation-inducible PhoH-like protein
MGKPRNKITKIPKINIPKVKVPDKNVKEGAVMKDDGFITNIKPRNIRPLTDGQAKYLDAIKNNKVCICGGVYGSGKSCLSVRYAINELIKQNYDKIVLIRPYVGTGYQMGHLPGSVEAKYDFFLRGIFCEFNAMGFSNTQIKKLIDDGTVEVCPLFFCRGRTFSRSIIIFDEISNALLMEIILVLTRMGSASKCIINGCLDQSDLPVSQRVNIRKLGKFLSELDDVAYVELGVSDVVREEVVKNIIEKMELWVE